MLLNIPLNISRRFISYSLNRLCHVVAIFCLLAPMGGRLLAEEEPVTGKFVVSFYAEGKQKPWVVNALEQNIYNDLSGYGRIVPFKKVIDEEQVCVNRDIDCILELYNKLGVDALMLATVDDSDIDYEIYDIQNKFLVNTGSINIGRGSSLLKLRMGAFKAFKSFIEKGGILEDRKYNAIAASEGEETNDQVVQQYSNTELKNQVLIFLAGFTCFPYLLSFIGKPLRHPERSRIVLRRFYPFQIVSLLVIGLQFALESTGSGNIFSTIFGFFDGYRWILAGLGGLLWGYFLIINLKIVVPHLQGIERIEPDNLFPLLRSCLATLIVKTLFLASFYLGFFYGVQYLGNLFSMSPEVIVVFMYPISGLYIFYWVALLLDVFSMSIDVKLAGKEFDFKNVWNQKIRKYFISSLKRNGVTLNKRLVDDIVFLPGINKGVVCYGGGFSRPRITIEKDLIKFALGDIDESEVEELEEYDQKAIEPVLRQNSVFQIIASLSHQGTKRKMFRSRHDRKKIRLLEKVQPLFQRDLHYRGNKHKARLENITQGIVFPKLEGDDEFPSLMSDNLDDMRVVEELLLEYSGGVDPYDEDAEIDDASEHDKDFLFGAILHKFGGLLRHEDIFSTIYLYLPRKNIAIKKPYNFPFSKYFAVVADTFVVLNFGLNHLMQHLYYQATNDASHLTQKGVTSCVLKCQDDILTSTKELVDAKKRNKIQTDELDRIVWLSRFSQDSIEKQEHAKYGAGRIFKWTLSLGVTYLASLVLINSYNYHPKYVAIIEQEKHEIAEAIKNGQEKERKDI
jgi:hypothetical protein